MKPTPFRIQDIQLLLRGGFSDEQIAKFTDATWLAIIAERGAAASAPRPQETRELAYGGVAPPEQEAPASLSNPTAF